MYAVRGCGLSGRVRPMRRRAALTTLLGATTGIGLAGLGCGALGPAAPPHLASEGIAAGRWAVLVAVPPGTEAAYVDGTSLLSGGPPGPLFAVATAARIAESRLWLTAGHVPDAGFAGMSRRCLLDLRLLAMAGGGSGGLPAGPAGSWWHVWPRDTAFVVAAFCLTGHRAEAERALAFLARVRPVSGWWHARYRLDGSGHPPDDRGPQADGAGWVPWAVRLWFLTEPDPVAAVTGLGAYWPMVAYSAELIATSLDDSGLPPPSPDYWEREEDEPTLGTAAALLAGLRAATDLARRTGRWAEAARWGAATVRLRDAVGRAFGRDGYQRYGTRGGADAAVTFLGPPFGPSSPGVRAAQRRALRRLRLRGGGVTPGESWRRDSVAWTPETAMFALAAAASGDRDTAGSLLSWLDTHRTGLGAVPEKVAPNGSPASVAPLGWTAATVLLTLAALERRVPPPPPAA
ncbi:MAG: glycoside hydrolase family 15 [Streptosporangiales bacterium]|nr:glycoside hydrolase family 15 [Streptosporangiales bacterium]